MTSIKKDKNKFKYQNEFRITFINDNDKCFTLDLEKSLRDIAVPIQAKDINVIYFKDGNLMYLQYIRNIFLGDLFIK